MAGQGLLAMTLDGGGVGLAHNPLALHHAPGNRRTRVGDPDGLLKRHLRGQDSGESNDNDHDFFHNGNLLIQGHVRREPNGVRAAVLTHSTGRPGP